MAERGISRQLPARWLIFAPVAVLVAAGVLYHSAAHRHVNLACFAGAMLYIGGLFLLKAELVIGWFQPDDGHSATATRWLGGGFASVGLWQLYNAFLR